MPTPIITLPIHTIEQARALAGLLRAFIDGQAPDTNEGADWNPDPDLAGMSALACHLDAGIKGISACGGTLAYRSMVAGPRVHTNGVYDAKCMKCGHHTANDGSARLCDRPV